MNLMEICSAFLAMLAFNCPAHSAVIFDNAVPPLSTTFRSSSMLPLGVATYMQVFPNDVPISQIAIKAAPGQDGQLKFLIFGDVAPPFASTVGPLLFSDTVNVAASGTLSYIMSDPLSFTLLGGHYYDVGVMFSGTSIAYSFDQAVHTQKGITSIPQNGFISNFTDPALTAHANMDINILLFAADSVFTPEPQSLLLSGLGVLALGLIRTRSGR